MLYYLLTARPPFAAETFEATLARVLGEEPLPPRHLNPSVPRDLEILCLKCLEKDPQRRFASASGLADELERFLESRPIQSRPIHLVGKVARWCRRKPALATMSATVVVAVTLGLTGVLTQWRRAERSASAERVHRLEAEHALHRLELQRAGELFASQNAAAGLASLALLLRQDPGNRAVANWLLAELTHRSWPLPVLEALPHPEEAHYAEFSPDGARILTAAMDNAVRLWETASGRPIGSPMQHEPGLVDRLGRDYFEGNLKPIVARFSPDGLRLATGSVDHTARVWDAQTGQPLTPSLPHPDWVTAVAFSPDGARLATACRDGRIRLWRARTGEWLGEPMRHAKCVNFMAFSPDGRRLLTGSDDATAQVWDAETGQPIGKPIRHGRVVKAGQFSPDGRRVATASQDGTARLWDAATGEPLSPPLHHENQVVALAFSPDGGSLATASLDSTVRLWDGLTGAPQGRPLEHGGTVRSVQFSPEGERLLTGAEDKKAYLWDLRTSQLAGEPIQHQDAVWSARFSPDGQRVVTASSDRTAQVWDVRPGAALPRHLPVTSQTHWVHWSPDGHRVLVGAWAPVLFDSATAQAREHKLRGHGHPICANFSPDSRRVLLSYGSEPAQVWDLEAEECVVQFDDRTRAVPACFSPDGRFILTGSGDGTAALREAGSYQLVRSFPHQPTAAVTFAEFSPDGQRVLTESGGTIRLWNPADGLLKAQWPAHAAEITVAHFSPDGRRVVTASKDGTARVWDAASGAPVTPPLRHRGGVHQAAFSPDGARVVTASQDDTARLWDARSGAAMGEPFRHNGAVLWAGFSPEGDRVVTTAEDGTARLWDGRTGQVLASPFKHPFFVNHAEFSPDGTQLATACQGRSGWIWDVPVVEAPVPAWLAELAEAVAGQRTALDRAAEQVPATEFIRLRRVLADASDGQPGDRWLEWFLADRSNRSVGPGASLSVHQAVAAQAQEAAIGSSAPCPQLASWIALHPARAGLWARASRIALEEHRSRSDPALLARAGWFSRRALDLAPTEAAAWWAHADWLAAAGDSADALRAMKTGAQLRVRQRSFLARLWRDARTGRPGSGRPSRLTPKPSSRIATSRASTRRNGDGPCWGTRASIVGKARRRRPCGIIGWLTPSPCRHVILRRRNGCWTCPHSTTPTSRPIGAACASPGITCPPCRAGGRPSAGSSSTSGAPFNSTGAVVPGGWSIRTPSWASPWDGVASASISSTPPSPPTRRVRSRGPTRCVSRTANRSSCRSAWT
ncbi:MAG: hypothetical protein M5U12_11935 [Verrucomicrobia bacterium]|nr:hypothetical protein [Verrucomicrobiota bacterium]